jgi:uncharacterized membrane protein
MSDSPTPFALGRRSTGPAADGRRHESSGLILGAATVTTGLSAGVWYAYACSVMPGLARSSDHSYVEVMQNINEVIQNPVFFASFLGAPILTGIATFLQRRRGERDMTRWTAAAFVLSIITIVVTSALNVPLNNRLADAGNPDHIDNLAHVRSQFDRPWVAGNIARLIASTAALACVARALTLRGRQR